MGANRIVKACAMAMALGAMGAGAVLPGGAFAKGPKPAKDDPSRKVCRNLIPSGSRLATRICKTQAEWDENRDKVQDGVLQFQMKEQTTYAPVPG
jgi:hypothetical protein